VRNWGKSGSKFRTCNVNQRPFEHLSRASGDVVQEKRGSCATWAGVQEAVAMTGEGAPLLNIGAGVEVGAGDEARVRS